jgi:ABC-type spermidine/putrescine transport system permease subunit II
VKTDPKVSGVAFATYAAVVYLCLYAPIVFLTVFSFNDAVSVTPPFRGFSLRWYREVWHDAVLHGAVVNSIGLGLITAAISVTLGTLLAFGFRSRFRAKDAVLHLTLMPMLTPGIVLGIALLLSWTFLGLSPSLFGSTLAGHVTYALPFVFLIVYPRVHKLDRSLEEAAMDLGAGRFTTFWQVVLPIVRPGIVAGAIMAFTLSFDEFILSFFLVGNANTLPIYLWGIMLTRLSPETNAIGALTMAFSLVSAWVAHLCLRGQRRGGR